jgi:hypothetical protein
MIRSDLFKGIQKAPQFWKIEGIFLVFWGIDVFLAIIFVMFMSGWLGKIIIIAISLVITFLLRRLSIKYGVRTIKKIIGRRAQPNILIATSASFHFPITKKTSQLPTS